LINVLSRKGVKEERGFIMVNEQFKGDYAKKLEFVNKANKIYEDFKAKFKDLKNGFKKEFGKDFIEENETIIKFKKYFDATIIIEFSMALT